ncbi:MAG TPA: YqaE/Pmp3 family membrane protein [Opitutae bacterium]|nr:YqaE/Pmp3 family membrane protein [Opitutae bacterium]
MNKLVLIIIAILLPPLAVFLKNNKADKTLIINVILWLLFYIPGLIHALIVIL